MEDDNFMDILHNVLMLGLDAMDDDAPIDPEKVRLFSDRIEIVKGARYVINIRREPAL